MRSNEAVEKASQDIAPVMPVLQDRGIETVGSRCKDGPLQANQ
jgi:hypothetical protein